MSPRAVLRGRRAVGIAVEARDEALDLQQEGAPERFNDPIRGQLLLKKTRAGAIRVSHDRQRTSAEVTRKGEVVAPDQGKSLAQIAVAVNRFRFHLRTAINESGLPHQYVARFIGVTGRCLSKMLAQSGDQKPIGVHRLVALPEVVKHRLVHHIATDLGVMNVVEIRMPYGQAILQGLAAVCGPATRRALKVTAPVKRRAS